MCTRVNVTAPTVHTHTHVPIPPSESVDVSHPSLADFVAPFACCRMSEDAHLGGLGTEGKLEAKLCKEGKVSKDAFYLIQKLLNINPKQRLTANLALKQGYFKINHSKGGKGARPDFDYFKVRRRDRGSCKGQWGLLVSNHPVVCVLVYVLLCMYDLMCFWWWLPRTVSHAHHRILILLTVTSFSSPYTPVFYPVRLPPVFYHVYHGSIRSCWRSWTRAGLITSLRRKRRRRRRGHGRSKS